MRRNLTRVGVVVAGLMAMVGMAGTAAAAAPSQEAPARAGVNVAAQGVYVASYSTFAACNYWRQYFNSIGYVAACISGGGQWHLYVYP